MNTKTNKKKFHLLEDNNNSHVPSGNITFIISFIIPVIIFITLYYIKEIFPFGDNCYLRSDMYHQYAPFYSELWNKLRHGEGLTYSWNIGMGTDFTSLFAYYLASPINWIIILFPQKYMIEIMNALIIFKLAGSSVSITYYISKHFKTKSCTIALFGMFYALSGYVAAYSWNIMWLDCILLLPLIMLGLERLVNENKGFLYCITLGLCIYTNYYISIMVCMSVVLYFVVLMISYDGLKHPKIYLKKFLNWCIYSLLAGGLAACLLLPEMYTFSLSASSDISFPKTLTCYFSVLQMLTRQLMDIPVHLGLEHYPNIYCGVAVFILIPLYVMNKKVSSREKIGKMVLLLIFLLAFNLNIPNFIWHGLHYPNSLPCRQAFIYIFFLITMSYEAFHNIKSANTKQLGAAVWIAIGFLLIAEQIFTVDKTYDFKVVYISGAFILLYALLLYLHQKKNWKYPVLLLSAYGICIIECTINMQVTGLGTTGRSGYLLDYDAVETVTDTVAKDDDSLYRMDKVYGARSKNDGAWHNYRSISTFSSTSNAGVSDLFGYLGFEHSTNAYGYNGATMFTNSLFSVKYVISNKHLTEDSLQTYYTGSDGEFIYKNNYTLPIGFLVDSGVNTDWNPNSMYNGIDNQNSFVKTATGISSMFTLTYDYKGITDVTFEPVKSGHMYLYLQNCNIESIGVSINGTVTNYTGLKNGNRILDIGYVTPNDSIEAYADTNIQELLVYTLETDRFINAFNKLNECGLQVSRHTNTKIEGTVNAAYNGTMMFSIPYDGGWKVYVDGKKVSTYALQNALLAFDLEAGEHDIILKYTPVNLIKGCIITIICIIILIAVYLFKKMCRTGKINTSRMPLLIQEFINEKDELVTRPKKVIMTQTDINKVKDHENTVNDSSDKNTADDISTSFNLDDMDDFDNIELNDNSH